MKALSVRAPWWWFILHGKDIENRDWFTRQRGTIYLHAGKWWRGQEVYHDWMYGLSVNPKLRVPPHSSAWDLHSRCGCIVGTIDVVDCVEQSSSPWFQGKYGFVLANPVQFINPIPFKGALGFFEVPDKAVSHFGASQ
jgi:hypothetical protein